MLLFVDNIFRFTQAGAEVSALLGRIPSAVGYQPTLATDMGMLQVTRVTFSSSCSSLLLCSRVLVMRRFDGLTGGDRRGRACSRVQFRDERNEAVI